MPQLIEAAVVLPGSNLDGCCPPPANGENHSFSKIIAQEHGVSSALIAAYLANRIQSTRVNGQRKPYRVNLDDLKEHYPYLSRSTISNSLNGLLKQNFLTKKNTNRRNYDRTGSYEFTRPADLNRAKTDLIHFETNVAEKYGINAAIILNNLKFWLRKNGTETYHPLSPATLHKHLTFLSEHQIKAAIRTLASNGVITANPAIPQNRTQEYRLAGDESGGQFLDAPENSGDEFLDERDQILDTRGENLDVRGQNLDDYRHSVDNVKSNTLKENCFKGSASVTPTPIDSISPFAQPLYLQPPPTESPAPKSQAAVPTASVQPASTPRHRIIAPPLPCSPRSPMTDSLPATYAEASAEYAEFIKDFSHNDLLNLQDLLLSKYRPFIAKADKMWVDVVFVPRTREDLYQHLKQYADHGLPSLSHDEINDHARLRPYRILSLVFLITAFSYCHPDSRIKNEHHTQITYELTLEISSVYAYRQQKLEQHLHQKHQSALIQLEQNRQKHTNDEEDNYVDVHLSPAEKSKVLRHYIDQSNAIGYVDSKAEIRSGTLSYTDKDLNAARIFFNTNADLSAFDIGNIMDHCQERARGFEFRKEAASDELIDGTKLGYALLHLAQITAILNSAHHMPPFKMLTFHELYRDPRNQ